MKFWDKVDKCKHNNISQNYCETIDCSNQDISCFGVETHCLDCGVYIAECACGSESGMSGWSQKRWRNKK